MIELQNVRVNIGEYVILRGVTLTVPDGEIVGLVGHNGAGKTTTLRSIMGLVAAEADLMRFESVDLLQLPAYKRSSLGIGFMPENRRLIGNLTAEENILLPAWATHIPEKEQRLEWIYEMIPEVADFRSRRATQLSGGQQKLLALARAMMNGSKLMLLDEPFEGVAPSLAHRLSTVITSLEGQGIAVLLAESDPRLLAQFAHRMYEIERGQIISETLQQP